MLNVLVGYPRTVVPDGNVLLPFRRRCKHLYFAILLSIERVETIAQQVHKYQYKLVCIGLYHKLLRCRELQAAPPLFVA